jgi:hypothetical protein
LREFCGTIGGVKELAYEVTRAGLLSDRVDPRRAQELYEKAQADPACELGGSMAGFAYWVVNAEGVKLVRVRVEPVAVESEGERWLLS